MQPDNIIFVGIGSRSNPADEVGLLVCEALVERGHDGRVLEDITALTDVLSEGSPVVIIDAAKSHETMVLRVDDVQTPTGQLRSSHGLSLGLMLSMQQALSDATERVGDRVRIVAVGIARLPITGRARVVSEGVAAALCAARQLRPVSPNKERVKYIANPKNATRAK